MQTRRSWLRGAAGCVASVVMGWGMAVQAAPATTLPSGPISLMIPFAPGGATDVVGRLIAARLSEEIGRVVVVENLGGAGGVVGAQRVARSQARDGSVLLMGTVSTHAINPLITQPPPYDPVQDFTPVSLLVTVPNVIVVHPLVPASNVQELVALLRAKPGELNYGTAGMGTPPHLSGELFKQMAGVTMQHVPYRGGGPAMADLMAGHIPVLFDVLTGAAAHIRSGVAKPIAVTTATRSPSFPDLPTVAESGVPGYETYTWNAIFAPPGTDPAVAQTLSEAFQRALADPALQEKLQELSAVPVGSTPEALAQHVQDELAKWQPIVSSIEGLKP